MNLEGTLEQYLSARHKYCIRLLLLQPSPDIEAEIVGSTSLCWLHYRPYTALSYVWGNGEPDHTILLDGKPLLVRKNLLDALKHLRLENHPRYLWIDAICINQSDIVERNTQVRQMARIYSAAEHVAVWLGNGNDATDAAMDFIGRMAHLDPKIRERIVENNGLGWDDRRLVFKTLSYLDKRFDNDRIVAGLVEVMENAWWSRAWTVQEIVLSRYAVLMFGGKSASWSHLVLLAAFASEVAHHNTLMNMGRPMDEAVFDEMTWQLLPLYDMTMIISDMQYKISRNINISLEHLMTTQFVAREATEPRDMVFSVLGLMIEKPAVVVDYARSKKQVFKEATIAMFRYNSVAQGPFNLLQDSTMPRDPTLPSWVPDFSVMKSHRTKTLATIAIGASMVRGSLSIASFGDTGNYQGPEFHDTDDVMTMQVVLVDRVKDLSIACPELLRVTGASQREHHLRPLFEQWRQLVPDGDELKDYVGGGTTLEAFWRTVTLDLSLEDRDYRAGHPDRRDRRLPKNSPGMPPMTPEEEEEIRWGILDAPVPKTILAKLGARRLFVTTLGYFGLGPASMQVGDQVCVPRGSIVPLLVREVPSHPDYFTIVGECYVHGIMDGEMVEAVKVGTSQWQSLSFI